MLRKINDLVSKIFTLEQKSGFKLEINKDLTFIVIIIDIDWYENNYRDNYLGHIAQPYFKVHYGTIMQSFRGKEVRNGVLLRELPQWETVVPLKVILFAHFWSYSAWPNALATIQRTLRFEEYWSLAD